MTTKNKTFISFNFNFSFFTCAIFRQKVLQQTSCYTEKMFSLSSYQNCEKNCSSYRRRSFNSSLHSIDETESLDFPRTRKRESCTSNVYPEKRQSDPLLHCAFINKGFDVDVNNHMNVSLYNRRADTYSCLQHHQTTDHPKRNVYPKIKVRISDECGNRIDNSLDSQSDSEVDDCWNFGAASGNQFDDRDDAFNIRNSDIAKTIVNKCRKCGHKSLRAQFSTAFC